MRNLFRLALISTLALALGIGLAQRPKELVIGWTADEFDVEINRVRLGMYPLNTGICESLFKLSKDFRVQPSLADSFEYRGNNTFRIKLHKGIKFHDGQPLTSEAVKYSLDRTVKANVGYSQLGENSVKIVDDLTVDITPARTNLRLIEQLVHTTYSIIAPNSDQRTKPVCTGPYRFVEYVPKDRIVVEANPDYWGTKPRTARIVYKFIADDNTRLLALLSGQVDAIVNAPRSAVKVIQSNPNLQVVTGQAGAVIMVTANAKGNDEYNVLSDVRVRKAVAYAINRKSLIGDVLENLALPNNTVNPGEALGAYAGLVKPLPYNPEGAAKLLEDAGWKLGNDGIRAKSDKRLTVTLVLSSVGGVGPEVTQYVQDQLRRVGIELKIEPVDNATFSSRQTKGQFDLITWLPNQNDANPAFLLQLWWSKVATANAGPWVQAGPDFDAIIDKILSNPSNPQELRKLSADAMRVLIEQQTIAFPLAGVYRIYGLKKSLTGFAPHPAIQYLDWRNVGFGN